MHERADIIDLRVRDQAEQVLDAPDAVDQRDQLGCSARVLDELHHSLDGAERLDELHHSLDGAERLDELERGLDAADGTHQPDCLTDLPTSCTRRIACGIRPPHWVKRKDATAFELDTAKPRTILNSALPNSLPRSYGDRPGVVTAR
jgi:hypothetical protein